MADLKSGDNRSRLKQEGNMSKKQSNHTSNTSECNLGKSRHQDVQSKLESNLMCQGKVAVRRDKTLNLMGSILLTDKADN